MPELEKILTIIKYVIFFAAIVIFFLVMYYFLNRLQVYKREKRYIEREISRSSGKRRKHYEEEKRKLWTIFLPINSFHYHY